MALPDAARRGHGAGMAPDRVGYSQLTVENQAAPLDEKVLET